MDPILRYSRSHLLEYFLRFSVVVLVYLVRIERHQYSQLSGVSVFISKLIANRYLVTLRVLVYRFPGCFVCRFIEH